MTIVIDDFSEAEDIVVVESCRGDECGIKADQSVTVVHEGLVVQRRNWETFLLVTWKNPCDEELEEKVARVNLPRVCIWAGVLARDLLGIFLNHMEGWNHTFATCPHIRHRNGLISSTEAG